MKHFLTLALTCLPLLCFGAPSISYTSYFNNTHTYTNATIAGTNFASRGVFTNSLSAAGFATSGTTNATLTGNLLANRATFTNGITAGASTFTASGSPFTVLWTNNASFPYETFVTSAGNISSAINSSGFGIATYGFNVVSGSTYRATFTLTVNSGTAPFFSSGTDANTSNPAFGVILTTAGANTITWTSQRSGVEYLAFWNNTGVAANFSVSSMTFTLLTPGVTTDFLVATSGISAPQNVTSERHGANATNGSFTNSVAFGFSATNAAPDAVAIGYKAASTASGYGGQAYGGQPTVVGSQSGGNGTALGYKAIASNFEAVAIGPQSIASGLATIAIGDAARAQPTGPNGNEVVIGDVTKATGNINYLIGGGCITTNDFILAFGAQGSSALYDKVVGTADHQGFLGWYQHDSSYFSGGAGLANDWWLGGPVTASAPHAITLNITSGQGSNIAGVDFTITGSKATGNAESGDIIFSTGDAGSSGSTLQTATPKLTIKSNGSIEITKTITAAATTGDQTINKASGSVNFAAAAQTITVTDALVTANSVIMATVATDDTTAKSCIAVPGSGSFVLKLNAAATAETRVNFLITN